MGVDEFVEQPRLSHPGRADRGDNLAMTRMGKVERSLERVKFGLSPDKRGKAARSSSLEAPAARAGTAKLERLDGLGQSLDGDLPERLDFDQALDQPQRLAGQANGARDCELLHSCRQVN